MAECSSKRTVVSIILVQFDPGRTREQKDVNRVELGSAVHLLAGLPLLIQP